MSPARAPRQRLGRPPWPVLALVVPLLAGCPGEPGPGGGRGPLDPGAARSLAQIDVRELHQRPRLTLIARDGDPAPAVVVAVLAQAGASWHTALAALLERRLGAAGFQVASRADALGLRLHFTPSDADEVEAFFAGVAKAFATPVGPPDEALSLVRDRVAALRRRPLDGPAQVPVVACGGQLGILASEPLPPLKTAADLAAFDRVRREALVAERTSLAVVGPATLTGTVVNALEASEGWPHGQAPAESWPTDDHHGAFLSADLTRGAARLEVALRTRDALAAVGAAKRASRSGSPLSLKLAATAPDWRLVGLEATAHSYGGCIVARLVAGGAGPGGAAQRQASSATTPEAAAGVVALVAAEIERSLAEPTEPFEVTAEIIGAADPMDAAARAAWWAITGKPAGQSRPVLASALAVSAQGTEPLALGGAELDAGFRTAVTQQPEPRPASPIAERRLAVERGQGELWLLVASPCALTLEGSWDAGRTALAALTAAGQADGRLGVTIEPWVSADGVGLIAHGGLAWADESPQDLARRVASAAGQALLGATFEPQVFDQAKSTVLAMLASDGAAGYAGFAAKAVPGHPSWIVPWGASDRQLGATLEDVHARWRQVQGAPMRVAVLANVDTAQAELAASRLDRWLLDSAGARPCTEVPRGEPPQPGQHSLAPTKGALGQLVVGVTLPGNTPADVALARQLVAALDGDDGLLRRRLPDLARVTARLLGGGRGRAVVVEARAARSQLASARDRVTKVLADLASGGLTAPYRRRGYERAQAAWRGHQRDPSVRLAALWRGERSEPQPGEPTEAQWRSWLARALRSDRLIVLTEQPDGR